MLGEDPKVVTESLRFPALGPEVTGAADEPMDGERRMLYLLGSSADASMMGRCQCRVSRRESRWKRDVKVKQEGVGL